MRFVEDKPGTECQLLGTATGTQSNWLSGQNGDEGGSMRGAANALRNQAAAMGGNVICRDRSSSRDCCRTSRQHQRRVRRAGGRR
ncbi:DUF4156 domain-containing protein [Escherichia coli]|nr:DUF4156 domain-containing protein [Escherichia coli]MDT9091284.1 DUF4156 domain-containing protein [Escherichia coli]